MTHDDLHELMLLYVAGALDADEKALLDARLASGDPTALAALSEAENTLGHLPLALDPVQPSAQMLQRLEARLDADTKRAALPDTHRAAHELRPLNYLVPWAIAAILAFATVGLSFMSSNLQTSFDNLQEQISGLRDDLDASNNQIASLEQNLIESSRQIATLETALTVTRRDKENALHDFAEMKAIVGDLERDLAKSEELVAILQDENLKLALLAGTEVMPDAKGRALWSPDQRSLFLAVNSLKLPDPAETYELWFLVDQGPPISLGTMTTDEDGKIRYEVDYPELAGNIQMVAISLEPQGGSQSPEGPTGPVVMISPVQAADPIPPTDDTN